MKRTSLIAGLFFGLVMGLIQAVQTFAFSRSPGAALLSGVVVCLITGPLFGGALFAFANSRPIRKQVQLNSDELIEGEQLIFSKLANLVVKPKDFGLEDFAFDDFLWAVGMKDKEALGGSLHLTNFRLIFKTHKLNRLRGKTSIFLPSIREARNSSYLLARKMTLVTLLTEIEVVVLDVDEVIREILHTRDSMPPGSLELLRNQASSNPTVWGDGLESWNSANTVNNLINLGKETGDAVKLVTNPLGALTSIFMKELFEPAAAEWWDKKLSRKG